MSRFTVGDIHGNYKALLQCLKRSKFDYDKDELVILGDVADGWPDFWECVQVLMEIKNKTILWGNHDCWGYEYLRYDVAPYIWLSQGGMATKNSIDNLDSKERLKLIDFFRDMIYFYISEDNKLFVHGGIDLSKDILDQKSSTLMWDRELITHARYLWEKNEEKDLSNFDEIYIGHTSTYSWSKVPIKICNIWALDQGAGWEGKLSIMNIDTKEYWQSDVVSTLYPEGIGRR